MSIYMLPPIKDAVERCFLETGLEHLDFGDIKFLLLNKELKRYPTNEKKRLYKEWEKQLKSIEFNNSWNPPFKSYDCNKSYLAQILSEMIKEKRLIQNKKRKYSLTGNEVNYIRARDKMNMDIYRPEQIISFKDQTLSMYGYFNYFSMEGEGYDKKIMKELKDEILICKDTLKDLEKYFNKINVLQLKFISKMLIHTIKKGDFSKKDKELAIKFIQYRLGINSSVELFEIIKRNGNGYFQILYTPDNYCIKDKKLINIINNYLGFCLNYFEPKPVVLTPTFPDNYKDMFCMLQEEMLSH